MAFTTAKLFIVLCATMMSLTVTDALHPINCIYTWFPVNDANYLNGISTSDVTLNSCKQTCIVNETCNGVDWNPLADVGQRCWLSGPWSGNINHVAGLVHYDLIASCLSNANVGCTGLWGSPMVGTNYDGDLQVSTATTLELCQQECVQRHPNCTGIDWNWHPLATPDQHCWLTMTWSGVMTNNDGISHYDLRSISCPESPASTTPPASTGGDSNRTTTNDECPLDILFILDRSGSVGLYNFVTMKDFVQRVISDFVVSQSGVHVAAIAFDSTAVVAFRLTDYFTNVEVENAVSAISYTGVGTDFHQVLQLVLTDIFTSNHGARSADDAVRVVVFITDGQDPNPQAISDAEAIRAEAIKILAVGIGSGIDFPTLLRIVVLMENFFNASDFDQLSTTLASAVSFGIGCRETIPYPLQQCTVNPPRTTCRNASCCKNCTNNLCNDRGLNCCWCDCLEAGPFQVCQCCPRNYHCCPYTPTFSGLPLARCCRNDQVCDLYYGSYRCLGKDVTPKPTELVCSLCDAMYLTTAARSGISNLYIDGREYPLPSNSTQGGVNTIQIPADAHVIAAKCTGNTAGTSGLIASVTHNYLLTNSSWKSTAATPSYDYIMCTYTEDFSWLPAYEAALPSIGGVDIMAKWIWTINNTAPRLATPVYFRAKFPQDVCNVDYGSCTNLCARQGKDCCHCEMARAGPTKVCSCCPRNYHCCPLSYSYATCRAVCCPDGYSCSADGRYCSTGHGSVPARIECGDCVGGNITVCPLDLCFVIDSSESIGAADRPAGQPPLPDGTTWGKILEFIRKIVRNLGSRISYDGIRVAAVMFNDKAWIAFQFTWNKDEVLAHINQNGELLYKPGATNLSGALAVVKDRVFYGTKEAGDVRGADVPKMVIIITDGVDNIDADQLNQTAAACKNLSIRLLAVGITDQVNEERLQTIVSNNETDYWPVGNYDDLIVQPLADDVSLAACNPENRTRETCVYFWTGHQNAMYPNGRPITTINNLTECKDACIKDQNYQNCTGINWSDQKPNGQKCSVIQTSGRNTLPETGSVYYSLTTDCRQCVYAWKFHRASHRLGGSVVPYVTEDDCKTYCIFFENCAGTDWNQYANATDRCWLSGPWSSTDIIADPNGVINYWELTRKGNECSLGYAVLARPQAKR